MPNRMHALRLLVAGATLVALPAPAPALVHYDFEQALFSEAPEPVLDHCVVEQDSLYHLFYLRGNPAVNIGHATTTDFIHWQTLAPVLAPGTWDTRLWAPYVIRRPDQAWLMYYTGVNVAGAQQSGIAISDELADWFKIPNPRYHPDPLWALWTEDGFSHGRDPHVMEYNGRYYMFVTAKTFSNQGAVACAVSDDLLNWEDIGPIYVHENWHVLESVFILHRNSKFHMFFTEEAVYGTTQIMSDSLLSGWDYSTRRVIDPGHAPQITDTHLGQLFSRHSVYNDQHGTLRYVLRFTPMIWLGDQAVVPRYLPLAPEWTFSGDAFYYQPTFGNNAFVRNQGYPTSFVGDGWINTYEYYTGPAGYGQPGDKFGEFKVGSARSPTFSIQGNSMSLLVGGGNYPTMCYVALVDAGTGQVLFRETGRNSDVMDKRYWNVRPYIGRSVYLVMTDSSTAAFGHLDVDEIAESYDVLPGGNGGSGQLGGRGRATATVYNEGNGGDAPASALVSPAARGAQLFANVPNPFNPITSIAFEIPHPGRVRLDVFDARGAHVRTLADGPRGTGRGEVAWDGADARGGMMASGIYFYRLLLDGREVATRKMVLLK